MKRNGKFVICGVTVLDGTENMQAAENCSVYVAGGKIEKIAEGGKP